MHPQRADAVILPRRNGHGQTGAGCRLCGEVSYWTQQYCSRGDNYLSLAHVASNTSGLADVTGTASGICFTHQTEDVLFARLHPCLNKVNRAEMDGCCSTGFHVLRVKDRDALLPEYQATILRNRLVPAQTTHIMTGNAHPRLTNGDVTNLTIPIPSPDMQKSIIAEIRQRGMQRGASAPRRKRAGRRFELQLLVKSNDP